MPNFKKLSVLMILAALTLGMVALVTWRAIAQDNELPFGSPMRERLDEGESDRWSFEGHRNDVIELTVTRTSGDLVPQLTLFNNKNALQARIEGETGGDQTKLTLRLAEFSQYTVEVSSLDETSGAYQIDLALVETGLRDFQQGELFYGQVVTQHISDNVPYQIWTFRAALGQVIDITMTATSGNLRPVLSLTSPGGDVIANSDENDPESKEAHILALRLPGAGTYVISSRRFGTNLGLDGTSTGDYRLELTLRNGFNATAGALDTGLPVRGRLTSDSPLVRYAVAAPGNYIANIELTDPNCLVDLALMNQGIVLLDHFVGQTPFHNAIGVSEEIAQPVLELSAANCPGRDKVDFTLTLTPIDSDLPLNHLLNQQTVRSSGTEELERWFFLAEQGDMVALTATKTNGVSDTTLRVLAPDSSMIFNGTFVTSLQETLLLNQSGFYRVQVIPNGGAYTLRQEIIGRDGLPFTSLTPIWEQNLDIPAPQYWNFSADVSQDAVLLVEDIDGKQIATAQSSPLLGPQLLSVNLPEAGRYRLKLISEAAPKSVSFLQTISAQVNLGDTFKGTLTDSLPVNRWQLPVQQGQRFDLSLEILSPNTPAPAVTILDQSGLQIAPQTQIAQGNHIELLNVTPEKDEIYTLLVSKNLQTTRTDYRLSTIEHQNGSDPTNTSLSVGSPIPEGFISDPVQPNGAYLTPAFTEQDIALLEDAPQLRVPSETRAEIPSDKLRQFWTLNIVRGQMLSVKVVSLDGHSAPGIVLFDSDKNIVEERWETQASTQEVLYRTPIASHYYIAITGSQTGERYLLQLKTEQQINETVPTVNDWLPLPVSQETIGEFKDVSETDTFAFWGRADNVIQIITHLEFGDLAPNFTLNDPTGRPIGSLAYDPELPQNATEAIELNRTGIYTLVVTSSALSPTHQPSHYSLFVALLSGQPNRNGLLEDQTIGTLGINNSENTWFFYGQTGESISLNLEPISVNGPTPIALSLEDSDENPFLQDETELNLSSLALNDVLLPRSGIYLVSVKGGNDAGGSYRLQLTRNNRYLARNNLAITYGDTEQGTFNAENLFDRWLLAGNQGDVIAIALRPLRGDRSLVGFQLESTSGAIIASGTDIGSGARTEGIVIPETGFYYIDAGAIDPNYSGSMAYELSAEWQNQTGSRSIGTRAAYDQTYDGTLYADDPTDLWVFEGEANDIISVTVEGDGVLEPAFSLFGFNIPVVNDQPQPLLSRTGTVATSARLVEFSLPESGAYVIRVQGVRGSTGHYNFHVDKRRGQSDALQLLELDGIYEDAVEDGQIRQWQFTGQQGDKVSFELKTPRRSALIPEVTLLGPAGQVLLVEREFDGSTLQIAPYQLPITGSYTLQVRSVRTAEGRLSEGGYNLNFALDVAETQQSSVGQLAYGGTGINAISPDNHSDFWAFDGEAGDVVRIDGVHTSGDLDPILVLTAPDGTLLSEADDTSSSLDAEILTVLPQTGRYMVEIAEGRIYPGEDESNYRLDLKLEYRPAISVPPQDHLLSYGEYIVDTLDPLTADSSENTLWYFVGKQGDRIDVNLQFPSDEQPLRLFIADGAGNRYQQGERVDNRATLRDFELPVDATYALVIQRPLDRNSLVYYPYTLQLNLRSSDQEAPFGGSFLSKNSSEGASFTAENQTHAWLYNGIAGETLNLTLLKLTGDRLPSLTVLTPDNHILLSQVAQAEAPSESTQLTLPIDGFYQIVLTNDQLDPFLSYRIAINSDQAQPIAGNLLLDLTDFGNLTETSDEQVWLFSGIAGIPVYARAEVISGNLEIALRLESPEGATLASGQFDPVTRQIVLASAVLLSDGEYRLVIAKVGGQLAGTTGSYRVRVSTESTIPEALPATPLQAGIAATGFVDASQPTYYGFLGNQNVPVSISTAITDGSGTPLLRILTDQGEPITTIEGEIENLFLPEDSFYLIEVSNPTPISFTITAIPRPNLDPEGKKITELGRLVNTLGTVSVSDPVRLWEIEATTGETIRIRVSDFSRPIRNDVVLFDPDGIPVATAIEPAGETEVVIGPIFMANTGAYTLRIGTWLGQASVNGTQYVLRVEEVGDVLGSDGGAIAVLGQAVRGGLSEGDPADDWTFIGVAGGLYDLELQNRLGGAPLQLTLKSPNGQNIDLEGYVTQESSTLTARSVPLSANGTYTVTVQLNRPVGAEINAYSLSVAQRQLILEDVLSSAKNLAIGETISGEVNDAVPTQAWVFFAKSGTVIGVNATTAKNAGLLLTLFSPEGTPLKAGINGIIEPTLLLSDGFYSLLLTTPSSHSVSYRLTVEPEELRTSWRETLPLGEVQHVTLSPSLPLHEWTLAGYGMGDYKIIVKPTQLSWQAKTFIVDSQNQVLGVGEVQLDGSTVLIAYLNQESETQYKLLVTGEGATGTYDILFDVGQNTQTPAALTAGVTVTGRISPLDTADEWLWRTRDSNTVISVQATRTEGDFAMTVRLYAPGNLFLQEYDLDTNNEIHGDNIVLPVEGTYIIQVTRKDDVTSPAQGLYELRLDPVVAP